MTGDALVTIGYGVAVGVLATVTMDVLGSAARKAGLAAGASGKLVGRWYLGIAQGKFVHSDIADAPERPGEVRAAMVGHYLIGIALAVLYLFGVGWLGLSPTSLLVALGYGLATCVFPWFLVYPSLGYGAFGLKGPSEMKPIISSVLYHLAYGFGLWWASMLIGLGHGRG
jgi:hypothetical protein